MLLLAVLLTGAALVYTARHFAMTADTSELISTKLKWRQRELAFEAAFPQLENLALVVVDGATRNWPMPLPDGAAALRERPGLFRSVRQPDGGAFFDRNGILLLPLDDVAATAKGLAKAQPLLASLAADPSLRGILTTLSRTLEGVRHGQATLRDRTRDDDARGDFRSDGRGPACLLLMAAAA